MNNQIYFKKHGFIKLTSALFVLFVCFLNSCVLIAQNDAGFTSKKYENSAKEIYDSAVKHINGEKVSLAKSELWRVLNGIDKGEFVECSDEHKVRLLQYKSHVVLANIAFAERSMWDLDREISFFNNADTTQSEWKRARMAATHFKHKYYQLSKGKFGKAVGDWVSLMKNSDGIPMVWIRFTVSNNTLHAELKDCAMKGMLSTKYSSSTNSIALDNVKNVIEVNFGDSRLRPGLQFLPSAAIDIVNDLSNMYSESIARQTVAKTGIPYSTEGTLKQVGVDVAAGLAIALITQLSVTKETVVSESFVMEQICPEIYMTKIKLRSLTAYSDGRSKDEFQWAEIPMFHLYSQEEQDF